MTGIVLSNQYLSLIFSSEEVIFQVCQTVYESIPGTLAIRIMLSRVTTVIEDGAHLQFRLLMTNMP